MKCSTDLIRIDTTPAELRELADRLERAWARATLGEDVPRDVVYANWRGNWVELHYVIDQDRMSDDVRAGKSPELGSAARKK